MLLSLTKLFVVHFGSEAFDPQKRFGSASVILSPSGAMKQMQPR